MPTPFNMISGGRLATSSGPYRPYQLFGGDVPVFAPASKPNLSNRKSHTPRLLTAQFGDGYEQRMPDGINHNPIRWSLTWNALTNSEADDIEAQLQGYQFQPFDYEVPGDEARRYVVVSGTLNRGHVSASHDTISVEIKEVFA